MPRQVISRVRSTNQLKVSLSLLTTSNRVAISDRCQTANAKDGQLGLMFAVPAPDLLQIKYLKKADDAS